ncbi:MAG: PilN domain-containing protein [Mariprofundaceae bacterium]|nr:PilN domain-containing protein [Mariprofundaceae bacterium]
MIRINLLPYRDERRQRQIVRYLAVAFFAIGITSLLVLAAHSYASMQLADTQARLQDVRAKNNALVAKIGELSKFKEVQAEVQKKLDLMNKLQQDRFRSLYTLLGLSSAIPRNVWLTQVKESTGKIRLSGLAKSNRAVSTFMRALEKEKAFSGVNLKLIKRQRVKGVALRSFSLTMQRVAMPTVVEKAKKATASGDKTS